MFQRLLRIDHAPTHRGRAGAVFIDKARGKAFGVMVQHIGDVTLLPKLDLFGLVIGDMGIAHLGKDIAQRLRVGAGKFDKLKTIGASGVLCRDLRFRGVMWERTHVSLLCY